jgi:HipA-like protein
MLNKLKNKIWKAEGHENMETPSSEKVEFVLKYETLPIGRLTVNNGVWKFAYTDQFREQKDLTPLIDFPNLEREYESTQLWPFFSYRIPGLNQPLVRAIILKEKIDINNEVALLKQFGKTSVFNPFLLTAEK